nr:DUF6088 family protein [uncultured Marinifilum sp.]
MTLADKIKKQIESFPIGETFRYEQLDIEKNQYVSAAKVLERLQKNGLIKKVSKGTFYKPKKTLFGELKPEEQELLKPYLFENGKRIAYITGNYLYNQLGLTTQLTGVLKIACQSKRIYVNTGAIKAKPVKSYIEVTDKNYQLLGFLDAMKDLKIIPNVNINSAVRILSTIVKKQNSDKLSIMINYALFYPPRVRALLGAILESQGKIKEIEKLKDSLNPLSAFKLGISTQILETALKWNIK